MALGDWLHQGPLQKSSSSGALAKSRVPSSLLVIFICCRNASNSSGKRVGLTRTLYQTLTAPGMVSRSYQSAERLSRNIFLPSGRIAFRKAIVSSSPKVSTPSATSIIEMTPTVVTSGWMQLAGTPLRSQTFSGRTGISRHSLGT